MLHTLRIRQFAIIEDVSVEFGPGLNLLTGETGAGKSILVGALGLLSGNRSDSSMVRSEAERAIVEALLHPSPLSRSSIHSLLHDRGLEPEPDGSLLLRREVSVSGAGRVFINGSPSTVSVLREIGERLLELHGQHEHQRLLSSDHHLTLLDQFGGHRGELEAVRSAYRRVADARERLGQLHQRAAESRERAGELRRQIREIDAVSPQPGERERIESDCRLLRHAGEVAELLNEAVELLYDGEPSASALAAAGSRRVARLAELDPSLAEFTARVEAAQLDLQEAGAALRDYRERADFDPARLERLEGRRAALESLFLKYGTDEQQVLARRGRLADELRGLENLDAELGRASIEHAKGLDAYRTAARRLTSARRKAAKRLRPALEDQLHVLALPRARVEVEFREARGPLSSDGVGPPLHPAGAERVELKLAANPGEPSRPLVKVASGGELSRVMLALHVVLEGAAEGRGLVFDEVDAGIGGAVADAVGARLADLALRQQVLCVTHLPQVAAYADRHYHVEKRTSGGRTRAVVSPLSSDQRVDELARMLGGRRVTDASRRNAADLLAAAAASPRLLGGEAC